MDKYSLEILNFGRWELERDFSTLDGAKTHGLTYFQQNEWRIFDRRAGAHVFSYSPAAALEETARNEVRRLEDAERWRFRMAMRQAADVMARQQRERMADVAARQRQQQRERELNQARRNRLQGFNFVGPRPSILDTPDPVMIEEYIESLEDRDVVEKVNWLKEGF